MSLYYFEPSHLFLSVWKVFFLSLWKVHIFIHFFSKLQKNAQKEVWRRFVFFSLSLICFLIVFFVNTSFDLIILVAIFIVFPFASILFIEPIELMQIVSALLFSVSMQTNLRRCLLIEMNRFCKCLWQRHTQILGLISLFICMFYTVYTINYRYCMLKSVFRQSSALSSDLHSLTVCLNYYNDNRVDTTQNALHFNVI